MLKVIYSETGQYLEHSCSAIAPWLMKQYQLAAYMGHDLFVEECTATVLLPANDDVIAELDRMILHPTCSPIDWAYAEIDTVEVVLSGVWISPWAHSHEGTFLSDVDDSTALKLIQIWADVARHTSAISR
ncbi:MAG: hypothetical protein VKL39_11515 [Leptolyngbyaceae bacterium]|nr:hypothetical protein [Leptolyngbyaceae bacterium]